MRIAVISDTHDRVPSGFVERLEDSDEIWHLGDVCQPRILDMFLSVGRPLQVVRGNCDMTSDWPLTLDLQRGGHLFHLVHIPPDSAPPEAEFVLHGHTHVPRDQMVAGVRFLNPGCVSRPNRGAPAGMAWLTIDDQGVHWNAVGLETMT